MSGHVDEGRLRQLVEKWRFEVNGQYGLTAMGSNADGYVAQCADELEALLAAPLSASEAHAYEGIEVGLNKCLRCGKKREVHMAGRDVMGVCKCDCVNCVTGNHHQCYYTPRCAVSASEAQPPTVCECGDLRQDHMGPLLACVICQWCNKWRPAMTPKEKEAQRGGRKSLKEKWEAQLANERVTREMADQGGGEDEAVWNLWR